MTKRLVSTLARQAVARAYGDWFGKLVLGDIDYNKRQGWKVSLHLLGDTRPAGELIFDRQGTLTASPAINELAKKIEHLTSHIV